MTAIARSANATVAGRGLRAREAQASKPGAAWARSPAPGPCARVHAPAPPRGALAEGPAAARSFSGQLGAVARELRELHVEGSRAAPRARSTVLAVLRPCESASGSLMFEQTQGCVDTARGDSQLVQCFRVVSQARARFVHVPRGQQSDGNSPSATSLAVVPRSNSHRPAPSERDGRLHIHRTATGSRFALAGAFRGPSSMT